MGDRGRLHAHHAPYRCRAGHAHHHPAHRQRDHRHAEDHLAGHRRAVHRLELQFATNAIANRIMQADSAASRGLLLVPASVITSILMVAAVRLEAHFGKGFDARPVGTKARADAIAG